MTSADPDKACTHQDFAAAVEVNRILAQEGDSAPAAFNADIRVQCAQCGEKFRWVGLQAGTKKDRPMCSVDEFELRAPLRPASADPDFGLGIPGYAVSWRDENEAAH